MIQIIAFILLVISLLGMVCVLTKASKETLTKKRIKELERVKRFPKLNKEIIQSSYFKKINIENVLKKLLLRIKIFLLRCENKIDSWLKRVSHSKRFNEDYWEKIKKE
jgi:hypothetical protein